MSVPTVYSVLSNDATVNGLVSGRITPLQSPELATLPLITVERVTMNPSYSLTGDCGLDAHLMHINCFSNTYADSRAIAAAVRSAMAAAKHVMQNETEDYDPAPDPGMYRITQEWLVWV